MLEVLWSSSYVFLWQEILFCGNMAMGLVRNALPPEVQKLLTHFNNKLKLTYLTIKFLKHLFA